MTPKGLKRNAKKYFNMYIVLRDKHICFTCGGYGNTAGHLLSSYFLPTRFDELNTHCQCGGCNVWHEHHAERYTLLFIQKYGLEKYEALVLKSNSHIKLYDADYLEIIETYKRKGEELDD